MLKFYTTSILGDKIVQKSKLLQYQRKGLQHHDNDVIKLLQYLWIQPFDSLEYNIFKLQHGVYDNDISAIINSIYMKVVDNAVITSHQMQILCKFNFNDTKLYQFLVEKMQFQSQFIRYYQYFSDEMLLALLYDSSTSDLVLTAIAHRHDLTANVLKILIPLLDNKQFNILLDHNTKLPEECISLAIAKPSNTSEQIIRILQNADMTIDEMRYVLQDVSNCSDGMIAEIIMTIEDKAYDQKPKHVLIRLLELQMPKVKHVQAEINTLYQAQALNQYTVIKFLIRVQLLYCLHALSVMSSIAVKTLKHQLFKQYSPKYLLEVLKICGFSETYIRLTLLLYKTLFEVVQSTSCDVKSVKFAFIQAMEQKGKKIESLEYFLEFARQE